MTNEKLKNLFEFYDKHLADVGFPIRYEGAKLVPTMAHVRWMCYHASLFIKDDRIDKAMRWLGFIQGFLAAKQTFTIEALKNHSKP